MASDHTMHLAYLSLGSNVGNRETNLREAVVRLGTLGCVAKVSSLYETEPVEFTSQPWFLNCAVALETRRTPRELMTCLLRIEQQMGRRRVQKKGPREIDLDILLFDDEVIAENELAIPHPAMAQRRFVLAPLAEIAAEARNPVSGKTVKELLRELPDGQVVRKLETAETPRP
jgi:2-amino-4-hydroxy-6-hydroxymethyldihydropteridine diphosphokinase